MLTTLSHLALILLYTCVLAIKTCELSADACRSYGFGASANGARTSATLSLAQLYHRTCLVLVGLFIFFIVFGLLMLVFQLVYEVIAFVMQTAHHRREEMERVARQLCYVKNGKLVAAPRVRKGEYHIFLSHVVS